MADLPEIYGVDVTIHPNQFPRIAGISIQKQSSMPVISAVSIRFEKLKKPIAITDRGFAGIVSDARKIAQTDEGLAVNLNPNNPKNVFYQLI